MFPFDDGIMDTHVVPEYITSIAAVSFYQFTAQ